MIYIFLSQNCFSSADNPSFFLHILQYWVSQGNKWCEFCKIYIANNNLSIRTHELGQRHKDNVAKRLANMRKEGAAREKEQKEAARALEQIETVSYDSIIVNDFEFFCSSLLEQIIVILSFSIALFLSR